MCKIGSYTSLRHKGPACSVYGDIDHNGQGCGIVIGNIDKHDSKP